MKRVLDVGNCAMDHHSVRRLLEENWDVQVDRATSWREAEQFLGSNEYQLVLVNRVLDGDGSSGLTLIEQLIVANAQRETAAILLTNYSDVQAKAIESGASGSFGKRELHAPSTLELLHRLLGETDASA